MQIGVAPTELPCHPHNIFLPNETSLRDSYVGAPLGAFHLVVIVIAFAMGAP